MTSSITAPLRALSVDDNQDVADSFAALLQCLGADVRVAYDGATALSVLLEFKPDLVVLDIGMPGMDGFVTARRIRNLREGKNLVLAALTAWSHPEVGQRIRDAGFDCHLVKPLAVEALEELLQSLRDDASKSVRQIANAQGGPSRRSGISVKDAS